ncbi:hypothetical protein B0T16DRAFT_456153 [Cercophora newfieldiana]|uniref:Uncharacterized protein n=1 Tax=Cercophora newfieldiana TaxID=92897 RepID=A0AA40CRL6_9PEZI|nr:hypothetical protein B0T16DRAFT_456153 [Cercophora newfieldiana]
MGFQLNLGVSPTPTGTKRLFSNLRPVSTDRIERTEKEYEEYVRRRKRTERDCPITLKPGESETVLAGQKYSVIIGHDHGPGSYRFAVDIHYGFGLDLAFLFSDYEAAHLLSTAKLHNRITSTSTSSPATTAVLSLLPLEIRQTIYKFALPRGVWRMAGDETFERENFPRGIGDPSGFYYPLGKALSILRVNKQIRKEALPIAYCRTTFRLYNLDSAIKFLVAVGQIGRENIETLDLYWESTSEPAYNWDTDAIERPPGKLPADTASTCIQLLQQCKRLRHLTLHFDGDLIQEIGFDAFRSDAGVEGLCSLQGLKMVDVQELGVKPLESDFSKWLEGQMVDARKEA